MLINVGPFWPPPIKSLATALCTSYWNINLNSIDVNHWNKK